MLLFAVTFRRVVSDCVAVTASSKWTSVFSVFQSVRQRNSFSRISTSLCQHGRCCSTVRGSYRELSAEDVTFFKDTLGENSVITDADEVRDYNIDWLKSREGSSSIVLRPKTTDHISAILTYCNERKLAVCPQGGNTGLVGGSIPVFDEIVLSTSLMNNVIHFDDMTGVISCQAGCILESLNRFAEEHNFVVPLDLGAKGSCQIGGNVSTNAGGLRLIRYGSLHANILGMEVVLADGRVLDSMNTMRKDNTGYDVKRMFVGSEGTLGVVTKVALLCHPKPTDTAVAFLGCGNFQQLLSAVKIIRSELSEVLTSLEMLDDYAADTVQDNLKIHVPISRHSFYILLEVSGSNSKHIEEKLNNCLNSLMEKNVVSDGTVAFTPSHIQGIWAVRERITESLLMEGCGYKYDISLPLCDFYSIVEILRERLGNRVTRCCAYGHLGDGNLHFNATTRKFDPEVLNIIEPFIYEWTSERRGSISSEHGIGYKKKRYLHLNKTPVAISIMKSLKQLLDPNNILNPYKVLP